MATLTEIGKYRVLSELGRGAMGAVYLAEDPYIARRVAIKVMRPQVEEGAERFLQEARTVGALSHPNIVLLHDFGFFGELPYLVMELVEGTPLDRWLAAPGESPSPEARRRLLVGLCRAVAYAHGRGVLHRDLKPSNVLVRADGEAKLLDFGIARSDDTRRTATGIVLGTPEYLAPELLAGEPFTSRSDLYSLGLVAYELFGGRHPFRADTVAACLSRVLEVIPPPLPGGHGASHDLAKVIAACLAKDPANRPETVDFLLAAAEAPLSPSAEIPWSPTAATDATRRLAPGGRAPEPAGARRGRLLGGIAALAVLTAAALGIWLPRRERPVAEPLPEPRPASTQAAPEGAISTPLAPQATPAAARGEIREAVRASVGPRATVAAVPAGSSESDPRHAGERAAPAPSAPPPESSLPRDATPGSVPASGLARDREPPVPTPSTDPMTLVSAPTPAVMVPSAAPEARSVPRLLELTPTTLRRGEAATLRLRGEGLAAEWRATFRRGATAAVQIRVLRSHLSSPAELELSLLVEEDAPIGTYQIFLSDGAGGASNRISFEVDL